LTIFIGIPSKLWRLALQVRDARPGAVLVLL